MPTSNAGANLTPIGAEGRSVLQIRSAAPVSRPLRASAWLLVVCGFSALAALVVLRAPLWLDATALVALFTGTAIVGRRAHGSRVQLQGEIVVDPSLHRLERRRGLEALPWSTLDLPETGVLVFEAVPSAEPARAFRVSVARLPHGRDADALWQAALAAHASAAPLTDTAVVAEGSYDQARGIAEGLARGLGWLLFDLASTEPERRDPDALDVPLHDRLETLLAHLPAGRSGRRPWGVSVREDDAGVHLALRSSRLGHLIVDALLAVPVLALLFLLSGGNFGVPILGVSLMFLAFGGRTHIALTPRGAVVRNVTLWMPLGLERILRWEDVEQLQVVVVRGGAGLRFVTDAGSAFVPAPSRSGARWAADRVRAYLVERGRHRGVIKPPAPPSA
jgi:hypothetical protein